MQETLDKASYFYNIPKVIAGVFLKHSLLETSIED